MYNHSAPACFRYPLTVRVPSCIVTSSGNCLSTSFPKNLTKLYLGNETEQPVTKETEIQEGALTVSGYLGEIGAEWLYNTYLPDAVKWTSEEFFESQFKNYLEIMAKGVKDYPGKTIASFEDLIEASGDSQFWARRGFDNITVNHIRTEYGKFDMKALSAAMADFNELHPTIKSNVQKASMRYGDIQEAIKLSIKQKGIKNKDTMELFMDLAQAKIDYSRANRIHSNMWENYSKSIMGLTVSPFTGLAGQIGLENIFANFRHASSSLKLHGITVNSNELMKIFDPENKEVKEQIHTLSDENKTKFITYKSKIEPGYTFIIMENGMAIKVADDKLE